MRENAILAAPALLLAVGPLLLAPAVARGEPAAAMERGAWRVEVLRGAERSWATASELEPVGVVPRGGYFDPRRILVKGLDESLEPKTVRTHWLDDGPGRIPSHRVADRQRRETWRTHGVSSAHDSERIRTHRAGVSENQAFRTHRAGAR